MTLSTLLLVSGLALAQDIYGGEDPATRGTMDAKAEPLDFRPLAVGCVATGCVGTPGCVGAAAYYYVSDPPAPMAPTTLDPAYLEAYNKEMKKRRARWALLGGATATGVSVVAAVGLLTVVYGGVLFL